MPSAEEALQAYDRVMDDRQKSNFNVGKSGRGRQLPPDLQAIIPLLLNPAVAERQAAG